MTTQTQTHDGKHDDECFICGTKAMQIREGVKESLLSGRSFYMAGASHRSRRTGYGGGFPPINRETWGHAIETFGKMARQSDPMAQVAVAAIHGMNLYSTDPEVCAKINENVGAAIAKGYDDVIARAGPEPPRFKDAQRPYTLAECVKIDYWVAEATSKMQSSVPGVGWCVSAIADELHLSEWECGPMRTKEREARIVHLMDERRRYGRGKCGAGYERSIKTTARAEDVTCPKCREG